MSSTKNNNPPILVSIITPVYNAEQFVGEMLASVLAQTHADWELLLVDDCSSDGSVAIIKAAMQREPRIKLIQQTKNQGAGPARNRAISEATGDMIAFLDADDLWTPDRLEVHLAYMKDKGAAFSHTSYGYIDERGERIGDTYRVGRNPLTYQDALKRTEISCLTAMYDVRIVGKTYMPALRRGQDYALWLDILKAGHLAYPLDRELGFYRQYSQSSTAKKHKLIFQHYQFLREREQLPRLKSLYYLIHWGLGGIKKYYIN